MGMEYRLELLPGVMYRAIRAMKASHPYEEPAFDVYSLMNQLMAMVLAGLDVWMVL